MRLTAKEHPETIRRYQHLRRARWGGRPCGVVWPEGGRRCTREVDHRGPHATHLRLGKVVAVWDEGPSRSTSAGFTPLDASGGKARSSPPPTSRRPVGLKSKSESWLAAAGRRFLTMVLDIEELALFLMFLAFVYFAIEWLAIIFR